MSITAPLGIVTLDSSFIESVLLATKGRCDVLTPLNLLFGATLVSTVIVYVLVWRNPVTENGILVREWSIPLALGATTVLANWIQAPALLFSGQQAFRSYAQFAAFWVPNSLALVIAAILAVHIREKLPRGYNVPQFLGSVFGGKVRWLTFLLAFTTLVLAVGYSLTGLRQWIVPQLGLPSWQVAVILGTAALVWVVPTGLIGAVASDRIKVAIIGAGAAGVFALWYYWSSKGFHITSSTPTNTPTGSTWVFWSSGVVLAASLIGGPIVNPDLGERFFAVEKRIVRRAYLFAAVLFALVVLVFGSIGLLAHELGIEPGKSFPAYAVLEKTVPSGVVVIVSVGLAIILAAAIAAFVASAANLLTIELFHRASSDTVSRKVSVRSRLLMIIPIVAGTAVASQDTIDIGTLLSALAVVRGEVIVPIIVAAFWPTLVPGGYVLAGMLTGLAGGVVATYTGIVAKNGFGIDLPFWLYNGPPIGALVAVFVPLGFILIGGVAKRLPSTRLA